MKNDLINELGTNFIEYAVAVNTDRAIPDATSGLKPVNRRILWSAFSNGQASNKPHVKAARVVGNVMGTLHPHGDSSIYGAMINLSQSWRMRYPLIDIHGNNGNIAGDGAASMRYTEVRLTKIAEDGLLNGIKKKNVDFMPTYDEAEEEPTTLPASFPNLLCNPNAGIGVAMACNWLPHNLKEVSQAIYNYMDGKEFSLPGPDFPTGGVIINQKELPAIVAAGRGSVKVRGRYRVEKQKIIFYEIPYGASVEGLISEIGAACDTKDLEGISNIRDESNKNGLRIVIECEKGINPETIVNKLFAKTDLQTSISYNQVALVDKVPKELTLKECLQIYVKHNKECLIKEVTFDYEKAKSRLHIVQGLLIALEDIDNVIQLIKKSESAAAAKTILMSQYKLSEDQSKAILDMKLSRLAKLEKIELEKEKADLLEKIKEYENILSSELKQLEIIRIRLQEIVEKYGDNRRTELQQISVSPEDKEVSTVVSEDCVVIISLTGEIKRIPTKSFTPQRRGGKGVKSENEAILTSISTNTIDTLLLFTNFGKMYKILVDKIPAGTGISKGQNLTTLVSLEKGERVIAASGLDQKVDAEYVVFITEQGLVKKSLLSEYTSLKKSTGAQAIKIKEGDSIANVLFMNEEDLILVTKESVAIRFETSSIAPIGRVTSGVKGIKLAKEDKVVIGVPVTKENSFLALVNVGGTGKKSLLSEIVGQGRGGKGLKVGNEKIAGAALVENTDTLLLIGEGNNICISASELPVLNRVALGNKLMQNNVKNIVKL